MDDNSVRRTSSDLSKRRQFAVSGITIGRLTGLDALRGLAALAVMLYHFGKSYEIHGLFPRSYLAVDFFFMLSGYVLARIYEPRLTSGLAPATFLFARFLRLWPLVTLGALIGLASYDAPLPLWIAALGSLFLLPQLAEPGDVFPLNGPTWSISFELMLNALHALLFVRLPTRWLLVIAALMLPVMAAGIDRFDGMNMGPRLADFWWGVPRSILPYVMGICLFRLWRDQPPIAVPIWLTLAMLPLSFMVSKVDIFDLLFVTLICPLVLAGGIRLNAGRAGDVLGQLSFPLYALHIPILRILPMWAGIATCLTAAVITGPAAPFLKRHYRRALASCIVRLRPCD